MIRNLLIVLGILCSLSSNAHQNIGAVKKPISENSKPGGIGGKHLLTLQWISWDKPGSINFTPVKNKRNTYRVKGRQSIKGDYVTIDGTIVQRSARELFFNGTIKSKVSSINNGQVCERKGPQTFLSTRNRKYWRLQQMENCEGNRVTDYIDIYF